MEIRRHCRMNPAARLRGMALSILLTALFLIHSMPSSTQAAGGDLDPSFGTGGKVTTDFGVAYYADIGRTVAIQPDGKIVAAGYVFNGTDGDFALARYNPDGTLDSTFGSGGEVTTGIGLSFDYAYAVAIQTDGKIVVAGTTYNGSTRYDFALARYNPDGTLDATFGSGGKVTTTIGFSDAKAYALAIQADGKIITAGYAAIASSAHYDFALSRYNPNGSLDVSFGTGGTVGTNFGDFAYANALALQTDGKIIVAGYNIVYPYGNSNDDFALARYNADGSLDVTFGTGGKKTTDFGSGEVVYGLGIQLDGKMVVAGRYWNGAGHDFISARYNMDGSLDTTFGTGGKVITNFGFSSVAYALNIQTDGKIALAGEWQDLSGSSGSGFALSRYNTDGSLDLNFGAGGKVTTDFIATGQSVSIGVAYAIDTQADGKLVAVGYNGYDFALARYFGGGELTDLSITNTDSPDPVTAGNNLTYTVTVTNNGPGAATGVAMTDTLPSGVAFVSATPTQGSCTQSSGVVTCTLGSLANAASATTTIVVAAMAVGTITNSASTAGNETDPNLANNTATAGTTVTNTTVYCNGLLATIVGTSGNDVITGTSGNDVIFGGLGDDLIYGLAGDDVICGDYGNDTLYGGDGNDQLGGNQGNDTLYGEGGNDTLGGGVGTDTCNGGTGTDTASGCETTVGVP